MRYGRTLILPAMLLAAGIGSGCVAGENNFWSSAERIEVDAGNAERGPWRMNDSNFDYVDDPTIAITGDGHLGVAWADHSRQDIFFQMYGSDGRARFAQPVKVSSHPRIFSWLPRIAIADDAQRVYALWQEIVFSGGSHGGEIFFARSTDGGATFGETINLSRSEAGDGKGRLTRERWDNGSLDLARGPQGHLYAAWTEYEGRLLFSRSTDDGASFSESLHVTGSGGSPARAPALEAGPDGRIHLAWTVGEDAAADIRVSTSTDGGRSFSQPSILPSAGHADAPKLAADGGGTLHLVYGESPEGPLQRYRIRYARQTAGSDRFSKPVTLVAPEGAVESVNFPNIAVGAQNHLHVTWELFFDPRRVSDGLGYTVTRDGGESFETPTTVPGTGAREAGVNGSLQGSLMEKLAANAAGDVALVNSTFIPDRSSHIWLWRKSAEGQ